MPRKEKLTIKAAIIDELARIDKTIFWLSNHPKVSSVVHPGTVRHYLYGTGIETTTRTIEAMMNALNLHLVAFEKRRAATLGGKKK